MPTIDEMMADLDEADRLGDTQLAAAIAAQLKAAQAQGAAPQQGAPPPLQPPAIGDSGGIPPPPAIPPEAEAPPDPSEGLNSLAPFGVEALRFPIPESLGRGLAAAGSSVPATVRQVRRLANLGVQNARGTGDLLRFMGVNPEENLAALDQETEEARQLEAPLMKTTAGKVGRFGGDVAQGIALTAATGGLGAGALASGGGRALANVAARDALAGGLQGALQDTGKGESIAKNVGINALLGGLIPVGGAALRQGKKFADEVGLSSAIKLGAKGIASLPFVGAGPRALLRMGVDEETARQMAHANALREHAMEIAPLKVAHTEAKREAQAAAKEATKQANKAAGEAYKGQVTRLNAEAKSKAKEALEEITKGFHVPISPQIALKAKNLKSKFAGLLKDEPDLARALDQMTIVGAKMPGKIAASLKSNLGDTARNVKKGSQAFHEMERFVTDSMMGSLPKARADALREAFESYGRGARSELLPPKPAPIRIAPKVPELKLPPVPLKPGTEPYKRTVGQAVRTAVLRAAALKKDRKEKPLELEVSGGRKATPEEIARDEEIVRAARSRKS